MGDPWNQHPLDEFTQTLMIRTLSGLVQSRPMLIILAIAFATTGCRTRSETPATRASTPLFANNSLPDGWSARRWNDVSQPAPGNGQWEVIDGVLTGSSERGSWLVSERDYENFLLEFEFKLGPRGNSGVGLRFPPAGDPAFGGLEVQMVDPRYYPEGADVAPSQLTGAVYLALEPRNPNYRPEAWNHYRILLEENLLQVVLNGALVIEAELDAFTLPLETGAPLSERPRSGRIGFQELSRGGARVQIRNASITEL